MELLRTDIAAVALAEIDIARRVKQRLRLVLGNLLVDHVVLARLD